MFCSLVYDQFKQWVLKKNAYSVFCWIECSPCIYLSKSISISLSHSLSLAIYKYTSICSKMYFRSNVSLLSSTWISLPCWKWELKSPNYWLYIYLYQWVLYDTIVILSICLFRSINNCFIYLGISVLDAYILLRFPCDELTPLSLCNDCLCLYYSFLLEEFSLTQV